MRHVSSVLIRFARFRLGRHARAPGSAGRGAQPMPSRPPWPHSKEALDRVLTAQVAVDAEHVPIIPELGDWSNEDVIAYFRSGGSHRPHGTPVKSSKPSKGQSANKTPPATSTATGDFDDHVSTPAGKKSAKKAPRSVPASSAAGMSDAYSDAEYGHAVPISHAQLPGKNARHLPLSTDEPDDSDEPQHAPNALLRLKLIGVVGAGILLILAASAAAANATAIGQWAGL
eukprot:6065843-Prymnesium_polylepis.1